MLALPMLAPAQPVSDKEYQGAKGRIAYEYKEAYEACASLSSNLRDVCRESARSNMRIAQAELEYNRSGSAADAKRLALVRADGAYAVSREKCDHRSGREKNLCLDEARAARLRSLAEIDPKTKAADAARAAEESRDTDYRLARERCQLLASGRDKAACLAAAKGRFGRS